MLLHEIDRPHHTVRLRVAVALVAGVALALAILAQLASAQEHRAADAAPSAANESHASPNRSMLHLVMSEPRPATHGDSLRAAKVASVLRATLQKYRDTTAAVADGYRMFLPNVKQQKIYHFTNNWRGMQEAFRFDPARPTSILYRRDSTGRLVLVGAMYTAPKRFGEDRLDARVPTSIARWHKHVNWCLPKRGETARWLERRNGEPVFGPESPIATKAECDAVGGSFHENLFGWMLHANVFAGDDPATIWGDEHAGHDMHATMKMDHDM